MNRSLTRSNICGFLLNVCFELSPSRSRCIHLHHPNRSIVFILISRRVRTNVSFLNVSSFGFSMPTFFTRWFPLECFAFWHHPFWYHPFWYHPFWYHPLPIGAFSFPLHVHEERRHIIRRGACCVHRSGQTNLCGNWLLLLVPSPAWTTSAARRSGCYVGPLGR